MSYWTYDREAELTCPVCGWSGTGSGHEELFRELLEVSCPSCGRSLLVVPFPTAEETREAAARGNARAAAEIPALEERERRLTRALRSQLRDPGQLPDIDAEVLTVLWDFEASDYEHWTVLRFGATELWRELAYWEGYERFAEVLAILRAKYGHRLAELRPTAASKVYLYGDSISAPRRIEGLNAELKEQTPPEVST